MPGFALIVSIIGLALLIFVHELGHFTMGKALKLKITEFFIGMPFGRPLFKFKRGETDYGVKPVLFGGYVKFPEFVGLDDLKIETVLKSGPAEAAGLLKGDQITTVDGLEVSNWLDVFNIVKERPGKGITVGALREGRDEIFDVALGERGGAGILGAGPTSTDDLSIDDLPMTLDGQKVWRKALVVVAGPLMNILLAVFLVAGAAMIGFAEPTTVIGQVVKGSAAARVGIEQGDKILMIGAKKISTWQDVLSTIKKSAGKTVDISVERNGARLRYEVTLKKTSKNGLLGVVTKLVRKPQRPVEAVKAGSTFVYQASYLVIGFMAKLVTEPSAVVGQLRSPIGVVSETAPIIQRDLLEYMFTLAGISVAIGIFNLLPIPPLDGGRIFISGVEQLIRRPMPRESLAFINVVGVSLLLMLMAYVITADIFRLAAPGG